MNDPIKKVVDDIIANDPCEHTFISFVPGDNPFKCNDCGCYFDSLPTDGKKPILKLSEVLAGFTNGFSTLAQALEESSLTLDAFRRSLNEFLPKDFEMEQIQTLGSDKPSFVITGAKSRRTSDPKEVEMFFQDLESVSLTDLRHSISTRFPDISAYDIYDAAEDGSLITMVTYIDGTSQRVATARGGKY